MNDSSISVRYAKALFEVSQDSGMLDQVKLDMEKLLYLSVSLPEYKLIIGNPVIKSLDKQNFLKALLGDKVCELTTSVLALLFNNSREGYLPMMARNFLSKYHQNTGVKSACISSVIPLEAVDIEQIKALVSKKFHAKVDLSFEIDKSLIGGFLLRIDDLQIDASISSRLKVLRQEIVKTK